MIAAKASRPQPYMQELPRTVRHLPAAFDNKFDMALLHLHTAYRCAFSTLSLSPS